MVGTPINLEDRPPMNPDAEPVYDEHFYPLVERLIALSREHRVPFLAAFQLSDEDNPLWVTTHIPFNGQHPALGAAVRQICPANSIPHGGK
jgi:hypothetical protein